MKFRLSTILLLIALVAVALGWYVDRRADDHHELVGEWYYPTNDVGVLGYTSLLDLKTDGTFTKIQGFRTGHETFSGTYEIHENGRISFHVNSKTEGSDIGELMAEKFPDSNYKPTVTQLDLRYVCRCAIDSAGFLVIDAQDWNTGKKDSGIRWETHARNTNYVIRGRRQ